MRFIHIRGTAIHYEHILMEFMNEQLWAYNLAPAKAVMDQPVIGKRIEYVQIFDIFKLFKHDVISLICC